MDHGLRLCPHPHPVFLSGSCGTRVDRYQKGRLVLESFTRVRLFRDRCCVNSRSHLSHYSSSICRLTQLEPAWTLQNPIRQMTMPPNKYETHYPTVSRLFGRINARCDSADRRRNRPTD